MPDVYLPRAASLMDSRHSRDFFIVARPDGALHGYLSRHYAGSPDVYVISDRRHGERRQRSESMVIERRWATRRRHSTSADLAALGVAIVTVRQ
jgi:hypothetical protein